MIITNLCYIDILNFCIESLHYTFFSKEKYRFIYIPTFPNYISEQLINLNNLNN